MRLQLLRRKENPILPLRQSKLLINKHLDCYCPTVTVSFLNCYCLTSPKIFNNIWSYRTPIEVILVSLENLDMRLQVIWKKENSVLPLRQSKLLINKYLDCYYPTVTVSFLNCYCLTSSHIFNYIWSYRTLIQARLVSLES
jgi:branched-subunit amino acid transport protein AzlD